MALTVLVVDDHPSFRSWVHAMLQASGFDVVGEAADGRSAIAETLRLRPEVVLLDVQLPDFDGFEVTRTLVSERGHATRPAIVLTSSRDVGDYGPDVERCGADGFISKADLSGAELIKVLGDQ